MTGLDHRVFLWVVHHRVSWLNPLFEAVTYLATGGWIWLVIAALLAWSARRNVLPTVMLAAAAVWAADAVAWVVKGLVGRPRPFLALHHVHLLIGRPGSTALPSSHATTAFAGATIVSYCFPRAAIPLFAAAATVAFSRVYVGVHYPSDVIAGALIGAAAALLVIAASRNARVSRLVDDLGRRLHAPTVRRPS